MMHCCSVTQSTGRCRIKRSPYCDSGGAPCSIPYNLRLSGVEAEAGLWVLTPGLREPACQWSKPSASLSQDIWVWLGSHLTRAHR